MTGVRFLVVGVRGYIQARGECQNEPRDNGLELEISG